MQYFMVARLHRQRRCHLSGNQKTLTWATDNTTYPARPMPTLRFTDNIQRHVRCPDCCVGGDTVRACLDAYFDRVPAARSYVLDDQQQLRKHMNIFINNVQIYDRKTLNDPVSESDELFIVQALSGGN